MKVEQLQAIKERFMHTPDGYTISEGVKLIEQMEFDGIKLIAEVERLQKALKTTDADLYVYKDLYNEMTDKSIELIKFLQTRISKGWGKKAVDLAMAHIQEQEKEIERLREALIDIVSKSSYSSDTTGFYLHCIHEKAHLALAGDSDAI